MPAADGSGGEGIIQVPKAPPFDAAARARALELYKDACASCHGDTARGDGTQEQKDDEGFPTRPRDLTAGVFKGSPDPIALYRHIVAGIPGSPMPMSDWAYGDDAWHLVNYVRSLSSDTQRARVEMKKFTIEALRVKTLPDHPEASVWRSARPVNLHLMPLWWRSDRPEQVTVRAVHDGKDIAILMVWYDDTNDQTALRTQDFRDAAAIQFSLTANPPFFAMGASGAPVNIWMWKSERQADLDVAYQDLDRAYPNIGIDSYPNLSRSAVEQPTRRAVTLQSDPDIRHRLGRRQYRLRSAAKERGRRPFRAGIRHTARKAGDRTKDRGARSLRAGFLSGYVPPNAGSHRQRSRGPDTGFDRPRRLCGLERQRRAIVTARNQ